MPDFPPEHPTYPNHPAQAEFGGFVPPPTWAAPPAPDRAFRAGGGGARRAVLIVAAVAALVGGLVGAGTVALLGGRTTTVASGLNYATQNAPTAKVDGSVTAAAAKIGPSVVTINVTTAQQQDTGSGVIIRSDGFILTNNHVISAAAGGGTISVTLKDGRSMTGTVVGADPSDDLAVVKVAAGGLQAATFASSAALVVGQTVVAVGAPLGLSDTVTAGIVSNVARPVSTGDTQQNTAVFDAVQTDAAINPGNSGGPLVDLAGDVVGINAAIATDQSQGGLQVPGQSNQSGNIGIGFAIPADEASRIASELIATGKATHAVMGIAVGNATGAQQGSTIGAAVRSVDSGSPAQKAGLQVGDVVTQLEQQRVNNADALVAAVRSHAPHDTVTITYRRAGATHTTRVTLGES